MLNRLASIGTFVGGAATMGLAALGFYAFLHDPVPRTAEEAVAQLARIADGMDRIVGDTTDTAARAAIVTEAARVAAVAARPLDDATAVIAHVSFGVFDLPVRETWDVEASDGRIIPLTVRGGATGFANLSFDGQDHAVGVGKFLTYDSGADTCRLLLVRRLDKGSYRFRWRCISDHKDQI
ncbi:hypothetical protein [Rhodovulum sp. MB263]|uniref:hypothetical protein n=1 Tax=Rhodovulum sp. (strain MB263) TaxID=308754 RepID=UPI0012DB750E|nr:hypothetical protein [Rhodovulum sp. MB263]